MPQGEWTATGAGNTISQSGFYTAGPTAGSYTVSVAIRNLTASAQVNVSAGDCSVSNRYEAESFSIRHSGPYLQPCTDAGGGQNFAGVTAGHWFTYDNLVVPSAGLYTVSLRINSTVASQASITSGGVTYGLIDMPSTGGTWQTFRDTVTLPALTTATIGVKAGSLKFNWFSIDNCIPDSLRGWRSAADGGIGIQTTGGGCYRGKGFPEPRIKPGHHRPAGRLPHRHAVRHAGPRHPDRG